MSSTVSAEMVTIRPGVSPALNGETSAANAKVADKRKRQAFMKPPNEKARGNRSSKRSRRGEEEGMCKANRLAHRGVFDNHHSLILKRCDANSLIKQRGYGRRNCVAHRDKLPLAQ